MKNLTTKKILLTSCIISIIVIFVVILVSNNTTTSNVVDQSLMSGAAAYVPLSGEGEIFSGKDSVELKPVLNSLFNWAVAIIMVLSVIFIILGAIQYMTTDAVFDKSEGKTKITSAIAGLILALTSWVILFTIDDGLLKMDIVVPKTINNSEPSAPSTPPAPSTPKPQTREEILEEIREDQDAEDYYNQNPYNEDIAQERLDEANRILEQDRKREWVAEVNREAERQERIDSWLNDPDAIDAYYD